MASLVLTTAVSAIGVSGPLGFALGAAAKVAGSYLDDAIFGSETNRSSEGSRLESLSVQSSTYGKMVPIVYGNTRIAGNIIWSRPIKEVATTTTTTQGGKGGGGSSSSSRTDYSYYVTLAIAICEGEVDEIQRVWADAKQLDVGIGTYRFYKGTEDQLPDSIIESYQGVGSTPAYRGMSYVVIEDFPLSTFGNRIPNFTFEVKKKVLWPDVGTDSVEDMVEAMIMIPGSGEFVYDTQVQQKLDGKEAGGEWAQAGDAERINMHNPNGTANALMALDQLEETCPNVRWVSVVVNWFGDDMDAGNCVIKPGVEYPDGQATTQPETWSVGSYSRSSALQITYEGDAPIYGGTPDDASLLRYLDELQSRGYKVFFLPMFLMDVAEKPWRGRVTGSAANVSSFFTKTDGYNAFITHYANLVKDKVDAFAIGSELVALNAVTDTPANYPAVNALVSLAATVKGIVGAPVKVTYAADWSEYHHDDLGYYHLDPLWSSPNIDMIGIDAYFPLTDKPQNELGYEIDDVVDGWTSGEGYDYYFTDEARTTTATLSPEYAWKNIEWWWKNTHTNPGAGSPTAWVAESKPIWFTEYGFPSVDGATNQPNVFYDPESSEGFFPRHSKGRVDFLAQRTGIAATLTQWKDSAMVEELFLWTWDARPFPYWPDMLDVWSDGGVWKTGHWVQGKFGVSALAAIVADLCSRAGLDLARIDVSRLKDQVDGFVVNGQATARSLIEQLMSAYFFDAAESDGTVKFVPRGNEATLTIDVDTLVSTNSENAGDVLSITRAQELELPQKVDVNYINRLINYQTSTQHSQRLVADASDTKTLNLPIVMGDQRAKIIADVVLYNSWMVRTGYEFHASIEYAYLEPADVIEVTDEGVTHTVRINEVQLGKPGMVRISGVADDVSAYDVYAAPAEVVAITEDTNPIANTRLRLLDIPALSTDAADVAYLRVASAGLSAGWNGAVVYRSDDDGGSYQRLVTATDACVMGTAVTELPDGATAVFDDVSTVDVVLLGSGEISSATEQAVLNGANLALVGDELIQFKTVTEIGSGTYRLSGLLRGRLGTEHETTSHSAGESFILLDGRLQKDEMADGLIGLPRDYKGVSTGASLGQTDLVSFTYTARALKPYAPVHITGARDGADDLTINWTRRTRVGGQWRDNVDAPLSETNEAYLVDIVSGGDVVRTIETNTATVSYSAADQTTDFGSPQSSIVIRVAQLSEQVGRGIEMELTI